MNELKDYVDFRLAHSDKLADAEGYPLELSDCKKYKPMRDLKIYGNSYQGGTPSPEAPIDVQSVGELVTDETDANYGKYKIPVVQRGINLFSMAKAGLEPQTINGITFTPLDDERIHIKGKAIDTTKSTVYDPVLKTTIPVSAGTYNVKSNKYSFTETTLMFPVRSRDTFVINLNAISSNQSITKENCMIYQIHVGVRAGNTREWDDIIELQLTNGTGTKNSPYEPYIEPVTTNIFLDEPLLKLGDYADFVDFKENKVVRRNKEVIPKPKDFSWRYTAYAAQYGYYLYGTQNKPVQDAYIEYFYTWHNDQPEKASHLKACSSYSPSIVHNGWCINDKYDIIIAFPQEFQASDGVSSTLADIQTWVQSQIDAGTPLKFTYRLKEPIEEPLNISLSKLTAKTTIIEVDTSLAPSNAYGKYIKK